MNEILPHQIVKLHWFTLFSFKAVQGFRSRRRSRYHDVSLRHVYARVLEKIKKYLVFISGGAGIVAASGDKKYSILIFALRFWGQPVSGQLLNTSTSIPSRADAVAAREPATRHHQKCGIENPD